MINRPVYLVAALDLNKSVRTLQHKIHLDYRKAEEQKMRMATARRPVIVKLNFREAVEFSASLLRVIARFSNEDPPSPQEELKL